MAPATIKIPKVTVSSNRKITRLLNQITNPSKVTCLKVMQMKASLQLKKLAKMMKSVTNTKK